ncbi:acyltransferase family protein [uncultured Bacteroides sp.]|jgi:acyltransferase|uniref:acyltransferase family protein n=1 Tax=uncultured Bacteroides sp. TaxID=162156 RepID=UPI00258A8DB1|nr:acyltransferase family protein [uncultured Bacteroides sp.]
MNRENWADYVKALAIWMMVFAHANLSNESISDFIGTFHMPVFFLISGYFDKGNKDIWNVVKKNVKTILIPYFFFSICAFSICWISPTVHPELYPGIDSWWDIYKAALIGMFLVDDQVTSYSFMPLGPLWFLAAMFIVRVFWAILLKILSYVKHSNTLLGSLYLVLFLLLLSVVCYKHVPVFSLDSAVLAFPFYIGGYLLAKYKVITYLNDAWTLLLLFLCCVSYLILIAPFNGYVDLDGCLWGNNILFFYINGFIGSMMCVFVARLGNKKYSRILSMVGRNTIVILGTHFFFLQIGKLVCARFLQMNLRNFPILASLVLSVIAVGGEL